MEIFASLASQAAREITGRCSDYFARCPVDTAPLDELVNRYLQQSSFPWSSRLECLQAIKAGIKLLEKDGVPVRSGRGPQEPVANLLIDSVVDAYSAARGQLPLIPSGSLSESAADSALENHTVKWTRQGICHILSRQSGRVLLIVSSTGVPLSAWTHLLEDRSIDRRCMIVQSRSGPLLEGGTPHRACLWDDVADIKSSLRELNVGDIDVLGWCDGCRVAIELARSMPQQIGSLVLLAPTVYGTVDAKKYPSAFEDSLFALYALLGSDSAYNSYLLNSVSKPLLVDLDELKDNPQKRANAVLRLPPHAHIDKILMPLSTVETFTNYVYRLTRDTEYDARAAIAEIVCPVMLVAGTHDAAVNTQAARDVLAQSGRNVLSVTVAGAGHHIQLLQYNYLSYVLRCFLAGRPPAESARLRVERLPGLQRSH